MGIIDAFNPEDRLEITYSNFYALVKNSCKADLLMNGIKNKVDHDAMYIMMTGDHIPEKITKSEDE